MPITKEQMEQKKQIYEDTLKCLKMDATDISESNENHEQEPTGETDITNFRFVNANSLTNKILSNSSFFRDTNIQDEARSQSKKWGN